MLIHLTPYIHLLILLLGKLPNWTFSIPFWQFCIDSARDSTHNRKNEWNIKGGSNVVKNLARNKMQRYFSNFQNLYLLFVVVVVVQRSAVDVDVVQMYLSISVSKATQKKNMFCLYFQSSAYITAWYDYFDSNRFRVRRSKNIYYQVLYEMVTRANDLLGSTFCTENRVCRISFKFLLEFERLWLFLQEVLGTCD